MPANQRNMNPATNPVRTRTDRPFQAWYLLQQRRNRLAATNDGGANLRGTEDDVTRETEDGQPRELES